MFFYHYHYHVPLNFWCFEKHCGAQNNGQHIASREIPNHVKYTQYHSILELEKHAHIIVLIIFYI